MAARFWGMRGIVGDGRGLMRNIRKKELDHNPRESYGGFDDLY
jgi:hypothetical protein